MSSRVLGSGCFCFPKGPDPGIPQQRVRSGLCELPGKSSCPVSPMQGPSPQRAGRTEGWVIESIRCVSLLGLPYQNINKATKKIIFSVLEARRLRSRYWQSHFLLRHLVLVRRWLVAFLLCPHTAFSLCCLFSQGHQSL